MNVHWISGGPTGLGVGFLDFDFLAVLAQTMANNISDSDFQYIFFL